MTSKEANCDISVVIPSHNEQNNVIELHRRLSEVFSSGNWNYEIIFVDDFSTDNTLQNLKEMAAKDENLRVISFASNAGQTAATKAGFDHASGRYIISMDSDLEHAPEDIPAIMELLESDYDFVSTWRYDRSREKVGKRLPSKISNSLARLLTGVGAHDFGSGFKGYRREVVKEIPMYGNFHRYIVAIAARKGYRFGEVKIKHRVRVDGVSHYGAERLVKGLFDLCYITLMLRFPKGRISLWLRGLADKHYYTNMHHVYEISETLGFRDQGAAGDSL